MKTDPLMLKAKEKATDCPHGHMCLQGKQDHLCAVVSEYGEKVLFVQNERPKKICAYCHSFADDCICICPVRYRLFSAYKI